MHDYLKETYSTYIYTSLNYGDNSMLFRTLFILVNNYWI
jgi:hypothetical protein